MWRSWRKNNDAPKHVSYRACEVSNLLWERRRVRIGIKGTAEDGQTDPIEMTVR